MSSISGPGWDGERRDLNRPAYGEPALTGARQFDRVIDLYGVNPQAGGPDGESYLLAYWRVLVKWRWIVVAIFIAAIAVGVAVTLLMTPLYSSSATVEIDRESAKVVEGQDAQQPDWYEGEEFFQTQYALLNSRSLAERVTNTLNLANSPSFLNQYNPGLISTLKSSLHRNRASGLQGPQAGRANAAVGLIQAHLSITPVRGSRVVAVTYESPNPAIAAQIAEAVAENYITSSIERRYEATSYARNFLQQRLEQVRQKLEDSEKALVDYAQAERIINIPTVATNDKGATMGAGQSIETSDLVAMNADLDSAKGDRIAAQQRWQHAQSASGLGTQDLLSSPTITSLRAARATLAATYAQDLITLTPKYPSMIAMKAQMDDLDRQIEGEVNTVKQSLKEQYDVALGRETALLGQVTQLKGTLLDQNKRSIQYNILQRDVATNQTLYDGLLQRYKDIGVAGQVEANNISVVDHAQVPGAPFKPKPLRNISLAAALGLIAGILAAFGLELLDESIAAPNDIETKLALPLLGSIPLLGKGSPFDALRNPRSSFAEAYYSARTALQFSTSTGAPRTVAVTSSKPQEGKTTTALALALNFSRLGHRVLLIDADLRHPSLHRLLGRPVGRGLTACLTNSAELDEVVQTTDEAHLMLLTSGPVPPNPAELLSGARFGQLLAEASEKYGLVVIDSPPVMGLADAPLIASVAAGTVFVIEAAATRKGLAQLAIRRLRAANARVVGCLMTKFNAKRIGYGYGDGYGYGYGEEAYGYGAKADVQLGGPATKPAA